MGEIASVISLILGAETIYVVTAVEVTGIEQIDFMWYQKNCSFALIGFAVCWAIFLQMQVVK